MPESKTILLIASNPETGSQLHGLIEELGHQVRIADAVTDARNAVGLEHHDAVIAEIDWQSPSALEAVRDIRGRSGPSPLLVLVPPAHVAQAADSMNHGADDYLLVPPRPREVATRLRRLLERYDLDSRLEFFQNELTKQAASKQLEARSPSMRGLLDRLLRVSPMRTTVLILGESGVGKELVARSIHLNSPRRQGPFMALNCAAIPSSLIESELFGHERGAFTGALNRVKGKFEIAHGGTLFLDEIAEMAPETQAKLLRVLEEREFMRVGGGQSLRVDVRVIAATNADLQDRVRDNRFRADLYYRLKVVTLDVPPLRERAPDIPALVATFLRELARANAVPPKSITPAALGAMQSYRWPGNVRELKNMVESLLVSVAGDTIDITDLPASMARRSVVPTTEDLEPGTTIEAAERELIRRTLEHTGGNRTHSADLLGIGVRTLQRKIRLYRIDIEPKRRRPRNRQAIERSTRS